jgi:hypothetical protein
MAMIPFKTQAGTFHKVRFKISASKFFLGGEFLQLGEEKKRKLLKVSKKGPFFLGKSCHIKVICKVMRLGGKNSQFQHNRASSVCNWE